MTQSTTNLNRIAERGGIIAFLATVISAYISAFLTATRPFTWTEIVVSLALGALYTFNGLVGIKYFESRQTLSAKLAYFGVQIVLAWAIIYSQGLFFLSAVICLPLIAQSVSLFAWRGVLVTSALIFAAAILPYGLEGGWRAFLQAGFGYLASVVFVAAFTHIALNERRAREEVERLAGELREANRKLGEYATQVEELATTKERNRLAREIHDSVGHYLTVANVQLEAARVVFDSDRDRARDALEKAQRLVREGLGEVRHAVAAVRAAPTEQRSLTAAIESLIAESRAAGAAATLHVQGQPRALSPQAELTLYRAAQEGLTNTRKHARAQQAQLTLDYRDAAHVRLVVKDDGVGAHDEPQDPAGLAAAGFGLLGVRERAQLLGGVVRTQSAAGQGFTLEVELPV